MKIGTMLCWLVVALAGYAGAGITYRPSDRIIRVSDYPAEYPCTPERIYAADRRMGWNVASYDRTDAVYTITANLWIGNNDGTETYFQIGNAGRTNETLIVNGNVVVYPDYIKDQNPEAYWWQAEKKVNRLTIGAATNAAIKATLKIGSAKGNEHTLYVGVVPLPNNTVLRECHGGQMHVYNGTLTAAVQDKEHAVGAADQNRMSYWCGDSHVLENATLSWMAGMTYGSIRSSSNTVFEHSGTVLVPDNVRHVGSIFRNLKTAILDNGSCDVELVDCVLTNNACNWSLVNGGKGVVTVDCQIAPPTQGDVYRCWENPKTKIRRYPAWISRRHIVVAVKDELGAAVTNAIVQVHSEQEGLDLIDNGKTAVDKSGVTPARGSPKAILLTELIKLASDQPNEPTTREYTYGIRITAPGYAPSELKGFCPKSSGEVVAIMLHKGK